MHDALHLAPVGRAHGNDEAVVSQRDVVFARIAAARAQDALERFPDRFARVPNAAANAPQFGRSVVADFAVRKHGAADGHGQRTQIRDGGSAGREKRKFPGRIVNNITDASGASGIIAEPSRKLSRSHAAVSASDAASSSIGGASTEAGDSSSASHCSGSASEPKPISPASRW